MIVRLTPIEKRIIKANVVLNSTKLDVYEAWKVVFAF